MIILPAIDLQNGKCVRLFQGDYATAKVVAESPVETAKPVSYTHLDVYKRQTVRSDDFDGVTAIQGKDAVYRKMKDLDTKIKNREASAKEESEFGTLQIINEMLARKIELLPVDLYQSHATKFLVEDGRIRLPFSSLGGVGGAAGFGVFFSRIWRIEEKAA